MAVIQISKIQVRRGTTIEEGGMPQLASGEIGWSVDEQRLFIGNGSIAEGAPAIGNTEILTQFSTATINLFDSIYIYQDGVVITGTGTNFPIELSLQQRLDERVSVKAFGAVGDGSTDDTQAIMRAIKQHYVENSAQAFKKELFFPAGRYIVTGTIYLPPNVGVKGEGPFRTIIRATGTNNTTIFQTRSTTGTNFLTPISAQSEVVNNVSIDGIGFEYHPSNSLTTTTTQLVVLDRAANAEVKNCSFVGTYTLGQTASDNYVGLHIKGISFNNNIKLENLEFSNLINGVSINGSVQDISISDCDFSTLKNGVVAVNGSTRVKAERNIFRYIDREAIYVSTSSRFLSSGNTFEDVGSGGSNDQLMSYPVINFNTSTFSVSSNDIFKRRDYVNTTSAIKPYVSGVTELYLTEKKVTLTAAADQTLEYIPFDDRMTNIQVNYALEKTGNRTRTGSFIINASSAGINYTDTYNYLGASSIENTLLKAEFTNSNSAVVLKIDQLNDATTGNISFSINYQT